MAPSFAPLEEGPPAMFAAAMPRPRVDPVTQGFIFGLIGVIIFGGSLPATRAAVLALDPWFVSSARAVGAATLGTGWLAFQRATLPTGRDWLGLVVVGLCVVVGFPVFTGLAMRWVPASHGILFVGLIPLATCLVGALLGTEFRAADVADVLRSEPTGTARDLEPALRAGLITTGSPDRYRFNHGLVRDAVAAQVTGVDRAQLHADIARAFAARALDLDFDLSFSGIVTFKTARSIHEVAAWAPAGAGLLPPQNLRPARWRPAPFA